MDETTKADVAVDPPKNARQLLISWTNEQQHWVRAIVREIMATRQPPSDMALDEAYGMCLIERELKSGEIREIPKLQISEAGIEATERLELVSLKDVAHVNRLASNQEIWFNPRMTIFFGENATGKSGYVRILKRVAAVRSAESILPDITSKTMGGVPEATLTFRLGGANGELQWRNESGARPFDRLSVFDSRALSFHVDEDLTYVYTPRDLALFQFVHQGIKAVAVRLERARDAAKAGPNPFLERFRQGSIVYPKVETLSGATDLNQLKNLASVTDEEVGHLATLRETVDALNPASFQPRLEIAHANRDMFSSALSILNDVVSFDWERYAYLLHNVHAAETQYAQANADVFKESGIPKVMADSWQRFIAAGKAYLEDVGRDEYPRQGDKCIYCRQDLTEKALDLVGKYQEFSTNHVKAALDKAQSELRDQSAILTKLDTNQIIQQLEHKLAVLAGDTRELTASTLDFMVKLVPILAGVRAGKVVNVRDLLTQARETKQTLSIHLADNTERIELLKKQGADRARELTTQSSRLRDLEDRITLMSLFPKIKAHVESARWAQQADTIIRERFPLLLRSLTKEQKVASEDLLNQDFEKLFRSECAALRAPLVRLQFPGRAGETARRKSIAADHRLSEVLSEGEQKVIAMSDFLAEAALRAGSAPILFDDPVNSLDYRRLDYIIHRLYNLSADHQVIVFTHNIWFATGLLSKFEKHTKQCVYYNIDRDEQGLTGLIARGTHPRWDTVRDLQGKINASIQTAGTLMGETRQAVVEKTYSQLRSWCEVVTEQELFAGVTQRYKPNVAMTNLSKIKPDRLGKAIEVLFRVFEKACRATEAHSQPFETLGVPPTLEDLKTDWKEAQAARDEYEKGS